MNLVDVAHVFCFCYFSFINKNRKSVVTAVKFSNFSKPELYVYEHNIC